MNQSYQHSNQQRIAMTKKTTDQDMNRNPEGKGGFGDNPQNRNPGGWVKTDTPRFKLEKMMKLSHKELQDFAMDEDQPLFDRKLAKFIADGEWKTIREMVAEVYGTPKSTTDITSGGQPIKTVVEIIDARSKSTNTD